MKQTAVEWLEKKFRENLKHVVINNDHVLMESFFLQAKEMEKQQHGQTWDKSLDNLKARGMNEMRAYCDFDDYYNETYKQD